MREINKAENMTSCVKNDNVLVNGRANSISDSDIRLIQISESSNVRRHVVVSGFFSSLSRECVIANRRMRRTSHYIANISPSGKR